MPGRPAFLGMDGFAIDEADELIGHVKRGDQERLVALGFGVCGEVVEDRLDGLGQLRARGEQADVGVEAGGDRVVVAGAEVDIAAHDAVGIAADEQRKFAVGLLAEDAVGDADACILELAGPADIGVFVEARHQLDDDGDILALAGLDQARKMGELLLVR